MPSNKQGARHTAIATKVRNHGDIVTEDGFVGTVFKVQQVDRWTKPEDAQKVAIGEEFELMLGGIHEALMEAGIALADVGDRVYIAEQTNALTLAGGSGTGTNEVQTISFTGSPTGGVFGLTFRGDASGDITYSAGLTAAQLKTALVDGWADVEADDITVTGSAGGPFTITFVGDEYAATDVPAITLTTDALTGGSTPHAVVTQTTAGVRAGFGVLPVGVVDEVESRGDNDIAHINSNAWQAFLPGS